MKKLRILFTTAWLVLTAFSLLCFPIPLQAADPLDGLSAATAKADSIVLGTVLGTRSDWNAAHTRIDSVVTISVEETLKGNISSSSINLKVPGGKVNGITEWVSETPTFQTGERMITLLKPVVQGNYEVYGNLHSKLDVFSGRVAGSNLTVNEFKTNIGKSSLNQSFSVPSFSTTSVVAAGPVITNINPSSASAGTGSQITISGSGFGNSPGSVNFFYCYGEPTISGDIKSWSDNSINVTVPVAIINGYPATASSGPVCVQTATGAVSAGNEFSVNFSYGGMKWPGPTPVANFYINSNSSDVVGEDSAIRQAAATWSSVPNQSLTFNYAGSTNSIDYAYNGRNEIMWSNMGNCGILAQTAYWFTDDNMLEADIIVNDYYTWSTSVTPSSGAFDVQSVILHEMGHWLNLRDLYGYQSGYSNDASKIMFGYGSNGVIKRNLDAGDIAGLQWIYPAQNIPASLTLTSPNGSENWQAGTIHPITWTYAGNPGSYIKIELLKDDLPSQVITSACSTLTGSYGWSVPDSLPADVDYSVRISSTSNPSCSDVSSNNFSISAAPTPEIRVTSPDGSENWLVGSIHTITWTYAGNPGAYITAALYNGDETDSIIFSQRSIGSGGNGSFSWTIPASQDPGNNYRVQVSSTANPAINDTSDGSFIISPQPTPEIKLTSPNGGESWLTGTTHNIEWTYSGNPGSYLKIELFKGGVLDRVISSSRSTGSSGTGSCGWTIPSAQDPGSDYRIKLTSTSFFANNDISNADFSITAPPSPEIDVISPNGDEIWQAGTIQNIAWTYTLYPGSYVKIELYKGGVLNRVLSSNKTTNAGSFSWSIPTTITAGTDYRIKVTSTSNSAYYDFSDNDFSITAAPQPEITVTSPNGGESWQAGTVHTISWDYALNPGSYVKIELYKENSFYKSIISSRGIGSSGSGSYSWLIPDTLPAGEYRVKVSSTSKPACNDLSDNIFTITPAPQPEITITSPNGGELWQNGTIHTISWTYAGNTGSYAKIELYKGGVLNRVLVSSRTISSRSYSWSLPSTLYTGSDYRIKITSTSNPVCSDSSDSDFAISGAVYPQISITSPHGSEVWQIGTVQPITWSYVGNPGSYVKLELYKGGIFNRTILSSRSIGSSGSGSYTWTLLSTLQEGSDYRIKISSTSKPAFFDLSDANFSITAMAVSSASLTAPNISTPVFAGSNFIVSWSYSGNPGTYVKIELLKGGVLNRVISSSYPLGSSGRGNYTWNVPSTISTDNNYQIRVTSTSNPTYTDISDCYFTITK
jgi:hypothetical protein